MRLKRFVKWAVAGAGLAGRLCLGSDQLDHWLWRSPLPSGHALGGVAFGDNRFVAVGSFGAIFESRDGTLWTQHESGTLDSFSSVAYGKGRFVAVGGNEIITLAKGGREVVATARSENTVGGVAYGGGVFVAAGRLGTIYCSPDGEHWVWGNDSGDYSDLCAISYGGGKFVAVGAGGTVLVSPDGTNWTHSDPGVPWTVTSVTYGNGLFVALASYGTVLTSTDAMTWTCLEARYAYAHVAYANGLFVAGGWDGGTWTSTDGTNWVLQAVDGTVASATWGNNTFVAVGGSSFRSLVLTSINGSDWTETSRGSVSALSRVIFAREEFLVVAEDGSVLVSRDGERWLSANAGTGLSDVAYGDGLFVAVGGSRWVGNGYRPTMVVSRDTQNWTPITALPVSFPFAPGLNRVTFGAGLFVAVGDSGMILTSRDGANWVSQSSTVGSRFFCVTYGGPAKFVAFAESVCDGNGFVTPVVTSQDGTNWTQRMLPPGDWFFDVVWGGDQYVAVGEGLLSSRDGITWVPRDSGAYGWLFGVTHGREQFVAVGGSGGGGLPSPIVTSQDGLHWSPRAASCGAGLSGVAHGRGRFVAVGSYGTILESVAREKRKTP